MEEKKQMGKKGRESEGNGGGGVQKGEKQRNHIAVNYKVKQI